MLHVVRTPGVCRPICVVLVTALLVTVPWQAAMATMIETRELLASGQAQVQQGQRDRLRAFLDRADVAKVLEAWGVEPAEAKARVDALSDVEVARVAQHLDRLPTAGGSVIGPIIGALVFVFVVLLITDLLGLTDIFPFIVKKKKRE